MLLKNNMLISSTKKSIFKDVNISENGKENALLSPFLLNLSTITLDYTAEKKEHMIPIINVLQIL